MVLLSDIILKSSPQNQFIYIFVVYLVTLVVARSLNFSIPLLIGLTVSLYIIYEMYIHQQIENTSLNKLLTNKLQYINNILDNSVDTQTTNISLVNLDGYFNANISTDIPSYLYMDPNFVNLMYSLRDYQQYSPVVFGRVLRSYNFMLKIRNDMEKLNPEKDKALTRISYNFEVAQQFGINSVNDLNSLVYTLPPDTYYKTKHHKSVKRLHILFKRNMDIMKKIADSYNKNNINTSTRYITDYDGPKGIDSSVVNSDYYV